MVIVPVPVVYIESVSTRCELKLMLPPLCTVRPPLPTLLFLTTIAPVATTFEATARRQNFPVTFCVPVPARIAPVLPVPQNTPPGEDVGSIETLPRSVTLALPTLISE